MSKPSVYYWPPSTVGGFTNGIALNQSQPNGSALTLVSNTPWGVFSYVNINTPQTTTSGVSTDIIRSISITSTDDNSGVTFVISGIGVSVDGSGNPTTIIGPISENLVGPNDDIVTSQNIYTIIYSITPTVADSTNISVGYGPNGITTYSYRDNNRNIGAIYGDAYELQMINNAGLVANTYYSLTKPQNPNIYGELDTFGFVNGEQVAFIYAAPNGENTTTSLINSIPYAYTVFWANVMNCTTDAMYLTILQPGI